MPNETLPMHDLGLAPDIRHDGETPRMLRLLREVQFAHAVVLVVHPHAHIPVCVCVCGCVSI